ncbi:MAG TPA: hypothetical protein VGI58_21675 [Streptosporangiaceae bacterium]|jgi:hypothetical protein
MQDYDPHYWQAPRSSMVAPPRPAHSAWHIVGIVIAVILAIGGLALIGVIIVFVLMLNSFGSNK